MPHTPGPWEADGLSGKFISAGKPGHEKIIAEVTRRRESFEARDNARLIAAAPDMVAALEHAVDSFEDDLQFRGDLRILQAAIAKAKGEA